VNFSGGMLCNVFFDILFLLYSFSRIVIRLTWRFSKFIKPGIDVGDVPFDFASLKLFFLGFCALDFVLSPATSYHQ